MIYAAALTDVLATGACVVVTGGGVASDLEWLLRGLGGSGGQALLERLGLAVAGSLLGGHVVTEGDLAVAACEKNRREDGRGLREQKH